MKKYRRYLRRCSKSIANTIGANNKTAILTTLIGDQAEGFVGGILMLKMPLPKWLQTDTKEVVLLNVMRASE